MHTHFLVVLTSQIHTDMQYAFSYAIYIQNEQSACTFISMDLWLIANSHIHTTLIHK